MTLDFSYFVDNWYTSERLQDREGRSHLPAAVAASYESGCGYVNIYKQLPGFMLCISFKSNLLKPEIQIKTFELSIFFLCYNFLSLLYKNALMDSLFHCHWLAFGLFN